MEQKFKIKKVIEHFNLDQNEVARILFPHVKYQKLALDRVLKGEASLDTEQLEALAKYAGVFVHDLFLIEGEWKGSSEDGCLVFLKGEYKAKLNYRGVFLSIYKNEKLIHSELSLKNMNTSEFVDYINNIINQKNKETDGNN